MGFLLLEGGREFQGEMGEADRMALALAGGDAAGIVIVPTAAVPENNAEGAGSNGVKWFRALGAKNAAWLPIVDQKTADDPEMSGRLAQADFICLAGGSPGYLERTLRNSLCLDAIRSAYARGAVLAGSSAGAMVLCDWYVDPVERALKSGFEFQKNAILIPHHNTFGGAWRNRYPVGLQNVRWVGIDEETGMIKDPDRPHWTVYGKGGVTVYGETSIAYYRSGEMFRF